MRHAARFTSLLLIACNVTLAADAVEPLSFVDVYASGEGGYHTYRIPAIVATKQGTLLAFCEGRKDDRRDHGDIDLVLRRSSDAGATWGPMEIVHEEGGAAKITIGNPCPVVDRSTGTIWLTFCRDNDRVFVTSSDDDGRTWAAPREITRDVKEPGWSWYAAGPGNGIQLAKGPHRGRLVFPCDHRVRDKAGAWKEAGRSHIVYSDDHGKTFKLGGITDWGMNECAAAELSGGRLMLNMRNYVGLGQRAVAISEDGGLSFGPVRHDPVLVEPVCQGSLVRYNVGEAGPARLLFSNPASDSGRHHLTVRYSPDEGRTWPDSRLVYEGSAAYSNLVVLPEGRIGLIFERDGYGKISFTSFPLSWLTDFRP